MSICIHINIFINIFRYQYTNNSQTIGVTSFEDKFNPLVRDGANLPSNC